MPLHTDIQTGTFDKWFGSFNSQYPSIYHRYAQTYDLASDNGIGTVQENELLGRNYAAVHWGDDGAGLRQAADFVWGLGQAVKFSAQEPVMVFRKGTPEEVLTERESEGEVVIDFGLISVPKLVHGYDGNITHKGPVRW